MSDCQKSKHASERAAKLHAKAMRKGAARRG